MSGSSITIKLSPLRYGYAFKVSTEKFPHDNALMAEVLETVAKELRSGAIKFQVIGDSPLPKQ